ncbi:hypothetical protein Nepgr_005807 [Nepenthes gracilis]|uniref:Chromo domain-containing protein n=1 Tax=Nepenthes gracilis TaxID=150966 RepID=A0AAD3S3V9_NEPGR|nr:hypothetical protein Nepgr_005807 [Nepenthes gracilis]
MKRQRSSEEGGLPLIQPQSHSPSQSQSPSRYYPIPVDDDERLKSPAAADSHQQEVPEEVQEEETSVPASEPARTEAVVENDGKNESEGEKEEEEEQEDGGAGEQEEEEEEEVDAAGEAEEQDHERTKLAEGFYEIEAIRKKRIFKGEPQYLIKWRGWPESSNTWEPLEHLQTCPDVVEAFEERLLSGQKKTYRKRKRKFTQPKNNLQYSYGGSRSRIALIELPSSDEAKSSAHMNNSKTANLCPAPLPSTIGHVVEHNEDLKKHRLSRKVNEDSPRNFYTVGCNDRSNDDNSYDENVSARKLSVQFQEPTSEEGDGLEMCLSKVDQKEPGQSDCRTGAKRRKSGSVRRFKQDSTLFKPSYPGNATTNDAISYDRVQQLVVGNIDGYCKNNLDFSRSTSLITRIVKPISYSASVSNNVQDVSVTFVAMRADGKEVMVDNKFLKANNPLLLINFYEQHLRYSPTS